MPPAPLLDVVRPAWRDDGVGDEVRLVASARSRRLPRRRVAAQPCSRTAPQLTRGACTQGDEAPSLDAALPPPASAAESALEAVATAAARLILAGAAPETPPARAEPLLSLAASPCGQARGAAAQPRSRDTPCHVQPWRGLCASHALARARSRRRRWCAAASCCSSPRQTTFARPWLRCRCGGCSAAEAPLNKTPMARTGARHCWHGRRRRVRATRPRWRSPPPASCASSTPRCAPLHPLHLH